MNADRLLKQMKAAEDRLFSAIPNASEVYALACARQVVAGLYEALHEMTELAVGPPGGVSLEAKRDVIAKARAALVAAGGYE